MEPTTAGHEAVTGKDGHVHAWRVSQLTMLAEKQPEFAALLESIEAEVVCLAARLGTAARRKAAHHMRGTRQ